VKLLDRGSAHNSALRQARGDVWTPWSGMRALAPIAAVRGATAPRCSRAVASGAVWCILARPERRTRPAASRH